MNAAISMSTGSLRICRRPGVLRVRGLIGTRTLDAGNPTKTLYPDDVSRKFSSYVLDGFGGGRGGGSGSGGIPARWPVTKANTIFNIVPQGHKFVVERFGKLHSVEESGWFLAIPLVDQIAYVIDVRERAIDIEPQAAITRDNVSVEVSGNLFVKFQDPEKAAYGALNPLYSVTQVNTIHLKGISCNEFLLTYHRSVFNMITVFHLFHSCTTTFWPRSTHNPPCDLPLVRWSSMKFCTTDLA